MYSPTVITLAKTTTATSKNVAVLMMLLLAVNLVRVAVIVAVLQVIASILEYDPRLILVSIYDNTTSYLSVQ